MEDYKNLISPNESSDIGLSLTLLIKDLIANTNICYLAKIVSIQDNKVSITPVIKKNQDTNLGTFNNCMVAFPFSGFWRTQFKLKVGDIGLAIVSQDDISNYKKSGQGGTAPTGRKNDRNDSIFFPLSLYTSLNNDDIDYLLISHNQKLKLEFKEDLAILMQDKSSLEFKKNIATLKADLVTIKSENTTLKTKLSELSTILENALIVQSPSGLQPFDGNTKANFSSWKSSLDDLFKD